MCVSAKADVLRGVHQPGDRYMLALYSPSAVLSPYTEEYTKQDEVTGKNYRAGGAPLQGYSVDIEGVAAVMSWSRPTVWPNATITARYGLVYNASKGNRALLVVEVADEHGRPVTSTNGNFKVDGGIAMVIG